MSEIKTSRNKRIIEYRQKNPCLTCKSPCPFEVRPCLLLYRYEIIEKIKAQLIQVGRQEVVEWINANTYYHNSDLVDYRELTEYTWQSKLKEWGLK